mmetsp:Transcript_29198/g.45751  ORF Transcript_29198/g.45751 Transcript_29198/m.45751 type:complete len:81 (-) Transcript_29198:131-373(-)
MKDPNKECTYHHVGIISGHTQDLGILNTRGARDHSRLRTSPTYNEESQNQGPHVNQIGNQWKNMRLENSAGSGEQLTNGI